MRAASGIGSAEVRKHVYHWRRTPRNAATAQHSHRNAAQRNTAAWLVVERLSTNEQLELIFSSGPGCLFFWFDFENLRSRCFRPPQSASRGATRRLFLFLWARAPTEKSVGGDPLTETSNPFGPRMLVIV